MAESIDNQEATRIARDLEVCANAWEPGARLVGNVTAKEIRDLCLWVREIDRRMISIDEIRPLVADMRPYADLDDAADLAQFGNCECGECWQKIRLHNVAVKRLRELVRERVE